jgi:GT2 family glycosyltransferase
MRSALTGEHIPASPCVYAVVLNWNRPADTIACLDSIRDSDYSACWPLVVDNGSTDHSVEAIRRAHPSVPLIETGSNLGYAGGNNAGIEYALKLSSQYILIVNNDVLLAPDAVSKLVAVAETDPSVGILGPKVYHREDPGRIQSAGIVLDRLYRSSHRGADQLDIGQFDAHADVDAITGCVMLVSRRTIETIGLIDTRFFMYREEVEWCCRARAKGFRVLYVPDSQVWHRSAQDHPEVLPRITYYMTRNTYLLLARQHAPLSSFVGVTLQNIVWLLNWTCNPKWRHKRDQRDAIFKAVVDTMLGRYGRQTDRYGH